MNWNVIGPFFKTLEKVTTENNLSDRLGNIFNTYESGIQINNKSYFLKTKKGSKNVHVLTSGEKTEYCGTVTACSSAAGQILSPNIQGRQHETAVRRWLTPRVRCVHEPEIVVP